MVLFDGYGPHIVVPIGKQGEFAAPIGSFFKKNFLHCVSPIGGVRITGPILLAQHKGNEKIGEARTPFCRALPIVIEIAY